MTVTDKDREYAVAAAKECNGLNDVVEAIAAARAEGAAVEREACWKIADRYTTGPGAARAIRARGED